ncbi:MAG TPA: PIG-L family deacetylase [Opitutaceae bacterium]
MKFSHTKSDIYLPTGGDADAALARTTHLCVAAHQDDIEIIAHEGIAACYDSAEGFFTGVVVTNGAGSPRTGKYAAITDEQMQDVRRNEQRKAADIGRYNLQIQLAHPSAAVKVKGSSEVVSDLALILGAARPRIVYLHNPADKHDTHIGVLLRCLEAIRSLPLERRPERVVGVEVWRDLDWLVDTDKVALDAGQHPELAGPLLEVFDSQITGKRYDLAALGRRAANATFHASHQADKLTAITWAMDLTPLTRDDRLRLGDFAVGHIQRFAADVADRAARLGA